MVCLFFIHLWAIAFSDFEPKIDTGVIISAPSWRHDSYEQTYNKMSVVSWYFGAFCHWAKLEIVFKMDICTTPSKLACQMRGQTVFTLLNMNWKVLWLITDTLGFFLDHMMPRFVWFLIKDSGLLSDFLCCMWGWVGSKVGMIREANTAGLAHVALILIQEM